MRIQEMAKARLEEGAEELARRGVEIEELKEELARSENARELAEEGLREMQEESVEWGQVRVELEGQLERVTTELEDKREEIKKMERVYDSSLLALQNVNGERLGYEAVVRQQESMLLEAGMRHGRWRQTWRGYGGRWRQ